MTTHGYQPGVYPFFLHSRHGHAQAGNSTRGRLRVASRSPSATCPTNFVLRRMTVGKGRSTTVPLRFAPIQPQSKCISVMFLVKSGMILSAGGTAARRRAPDSICRRPARFACNLQLVTGCCSACAEERSSEGRSPSRIAKLGKSTANRRWSTTNRAGRISACGVAACVKHLLGSIRRIRTRSPRGRKERIVLQRFF